MKKYRIDLGNVLLIHLIVIVAVIFLTKGIFGCSLDWLNQHVVLADEIRHAILHAHSLFPDSVRTLMCGTNFYNLSYYGYLRPDVLVSCLFPNVPMYVFVASYSILLLCASGTFSYLFFRKVKLDAFYSIVLSSAVVLSSVFFHSHSQLMFINYMPFLFLALFAVEKCKDTGKIWLLIFAESMIMVHSYYYSVSAYFVIFVWSLYSVKQDKKELFKKIILSFFVTFLLTSVLTIPTVYVILTNHKDVAKQSIFQILLPSLRLKGLLYNTYGCGLSYISWILIVLGLSKKETRYLSLFLIISFIFPVISWILSGCLYARSKILIALLPLVLYQCGSVMKSIQKDRLHVPVLLLLIIVLPLFYYKKKLVFIDCILSLCILLSQNKKTWIYIPIISMFLTYQANTADTFLTQDTYKRVYDSSLNSLIERNANTIDRLAVFSNKQIVNQTFHDTIRRASGYTSTYNSLYNSFLYDTLHMNVASNDRIKNNDENNFFYLSMLSCNTILPHAYIPLSYKETDTQDTYSLYQSNNTMPIAYATNDLYSETDFNKLKFPYTLDTLYNHVIVTKNIHNKDKSSFQEETPTITYNDTILDTSKKNISVKKQKEITLQLSNNQKSKILVITFHVKNNDAKEPVDITINGQHNHLSPTKAVYYNHNEEFTYTLSSNEDIQKLNVVLGKGNYTISDFHFYTLDEKQVLNRNKQVDAFHEEKSTNMLKGTIDVSNDGYFVTTLPYDKDYQVFLDGKKVEYEKVNTAFVGFPIQQGHHTITIQYKAKFKDIAICMSMSGIILFGFICIIENQKKRL